MERNLFLYCSAILIKSLLGGIVIAAGLMTTIVGTNLPLGAASGIIIFTGILLFGYGFSVIYGKPNNSVNFLNKIRNWYAKQVRSPS
jgi:hypothetical protein